MNSLSVTATKSDGTTWSNFTLSGSSQGFGIIGYTYIGETLQNGTFTLTGSCGEYGKPSTYRDFVFTISVTVHNAKATWTNTPTASSNLEYDSNVHSLLTNSGTPVGGTASFALGTNQTTAPTTGWSSTVPTATNAGTYYVWFKIAAGTGYEDSDAVCMPVTINHKKLTPTWSSQTEFDYNGLDQGPEASISGAIEGESPNVEYAYYKNGSNVVEHSQPGVYTVFACLTDESNSSNSSNSVNSNYVINDSGCVFVINEEPVMWASPQTPDTTNTSFVLQAAQNAAVYSGFAICAIAAGSVFISKRRKKQAVIANRRH